MTLEEYLHQEAQDWAQEIAQDMAQDIAKDMARGDRFKFCVNSKS